ncbi:MAG: hypothetical protein ABR501_04545, partial [Pyrinomonadaceae bacterium]
IRSRAAAGSQSLFSQFSSAVEPYIYRPDISVKDALANVRLAKQKIDRHIGGSGEGFNVKLQRGGIREIEFIAQALQVAHGGRDEWLRVTHTVISLGRLADRNLISEQERSELSDAYVFLRMLEHRLQMEHGLQTHSVPVTETQRGLVARRMGFRGASALSDFDSAVKLHTTNVRRAYDRIFADAVGLAVDKTHGEAPDGRVGDSAPTGGEARLLNASARVFLSRLQPAEVNGNSVSEESVAEQLREAAHNSPNQHRAVLLTSRVAASLDKAEPGLQLSRRNVAAVVRLCGASQLFGEMLAGNPGLIRSLGSGVQRFHRQDFRGQLRASIDQEKTFSAELSALRREWSRLLLKIGEQDAAGYISILLSNQLQTDLAVASINVAYLSARREMVRRYGRLKSEPRIAILALGRLASGGVDYGSDLDIIIIYDPFVSSPVTSLTPDEAYARLCEFMVAALSNITREGYLYRVDLRLRPDGKNGPLVISSETFLDYLKQRSAIWEWLAYVKLRGVAGDMELGKMIETHARHAIHEKARQIDPAVLRDETRRVRERLEKEKGSRSRQNGVDIKFSAGGMLDVYFAARYLQLRDDVADEGDDRSTSSTLERLEARSSLDNRDYGPLSNGYTLLRSVDHYLRLIMGKVATLPSADHPAFSEIAKRLEFKSAEQLNKTLVERMLQIRQAYERIIAG